MPLVHPMLIPLHHTVPFRRPLSFQCRSAFLRSSVALFGGFVIERSPGALHTPPDCARVWRAYDSRCSRHPSTQASPPLPRLHLRPPQAPIFPSPTCLLPPWRVGRTPKLGITVGTPQEPFMSKAAVPNALPARPRPNTSLATYPTSNSKSGTPRTSPGVSNSTANASPPPRRSSGTGFSTPSAGCMSNGASTLPSNDTERFAFAASARAIPVRPTTVSTSTCGPSGRAPNSCAFAGES
ncbi:hypothetical protein C8R43DRAFT_1239162 [Mycena crocata]|nr:hypothetical protein C8R43DRAFT_1239162 [Mycena crocata]